MDSLMMGKVPHLWQIPRNRLLYLILQKEKKKGYFFWKHTSGFLMDDIEELQGNLSYFFFANWNITVVFPPQPYVRNLWKQSSWMKQDLTTHTRTHNKIKGSLGNDKAFISGTNSVLSILSIFSRLILQKSWR